MRDLLIVLIVFGAIPAILYKPQIGVLIWSWLGYMNPHRLTWGFAYNMPFAAVTSVSTILGLLFSKEPKKIPWTPPVIALILFLVWVSITTLFALNPEDAVTKWNKVIKIQTMVFITLIVMIDRERIQSLIWVIVISLGFYGVKGGLFTVLTGGNYHVLGPEGSFITGNTEIGLALIMVLPLMRYLQLTTEKTITKYMLTISMLLTGAAIIGTYSRGALLGGIAMAVFMWLKGRKKFITGVVLVLMLPVMISFMPAKWFGRMDTIQNYENELSAMERIFSWQFGFRLGTSRFFGGGFGSFVPKTYQEYAPDVVAEAVLYGIPEQRVYQDAHSIYFGVLGEHGIIGLVLYLLIFILTWRMASKTIKNSQDIDEAKWAGELSGMIQVSIVGFAVGGAFLSLEYFDLFYHLIAIVVLLNVIVKNIQNNKENNI